jgi:hypothetical protein
MRPILIATAAALFATGAAFAADPVVPPPPETSPVITMPASAAPGETCAAMVTRVKAMTLPADPAKAQSARAEIRAADEANDDASCRSHVQNALAIMGG